VNLKCSVSISTGVPSSKPFGDNLLEIAKALGSEDISTLVTVNNLGNLYNTQGKLAKAEQMYLQVLKGYEKVLGHEHTSTLAIVNNLGALYTTQGKLAEAEQMYQRALTGYEKALGSELTLTLDTVNNLGTLYKDQGKLAKAEQMYVRALQGNEHTLILGTVNGDLDKVKFHRQFLPHEKQQQQRSQPSNYTLATEGVRPKPTPAKLLPSAAFADKHREAEEICGGHNCLY
jgi:tetratricopeptide (TPR) repeat protein